MTQPRDRAAGVLSGVTRGLHHVAIAVESLDRARGTYEKALGLSASAIEHVADQ